MGYEITFVYHEKNEDGKPDMENSSTFTKSVGKRNEEVPLEKVGAIILGQMARRDVYISNVHIFEYVKREVSFKETKAGIVIKNKKFNFDQLSGELKTENEEVALPPPQQPQRKIVLDLPQEDESNDFMPDFSQFKPSLPPMSIPDHPGLIPKMPQFNPNIIANAQAKLQQQQAPNNGPLKHEVFRPSREDFPVLQRNGFRLTMGKPYPIFREFTKHPMEPVYYSIVDDTGNRTELSSTYFEPMRRGLVGMENGDPQIQQPEGKLAYVDYGTAGVSSGGSVGPGGMPILRRN